MPTVMPEGPAVRKAVQWISKMREENTGMALALLIEQACMRYNLSPKDGDFLHRFFAEQAGEFIQVIVGAGGTRPGQQLGEVLQHLPVQLIDKAVDRLLDLMTCLHFAGAAQRQDYTPQLRFLWEAFASREASRIPPLLQDSFERQSWDRGEHLMYRGATPGPGAFQIFQNEAAVGGPIALIEEGDIISVDVATRRLTLEVPDDELSARRSRWTPPRPHYERGVMAKYAKLVRPASEGAVTL